MGRFGNVKSPGYVKSITWLSEIWRDFDSNLLKESFDHCGITSQYQLHSALDHIVKSNVLISDYIDDASSNDDLENFIDDQRLLFDEVDEQEDPSASADNNNPSVDLNSLALNSSASDSTISSPNASDSVSTSSVQNSINSANTSSLQNSSSSSNTKGGQNVEIYKKYKKTKYRKDKM
ncbi:unnamed protein product [Brachionus calyciflorus]|uniref:Uncharacterized protein n=1 Tax=Brachionus calyciflorus TaxID=104777 RepID=A0A813VHJ8_9BILA|nr:unnamed protein product [Brachionus calyciflorus]